MSHGLNGNYRLTASEVNRVVTKKSAGGYALGRKLNANGAMPVDYVGRADYDVNDRLQDHVSEGIYNYFAFVYCAGVEAAYHKECELYHGFNPPDNKVHPAKPWATLKCRICGA